MKYIEEKIVTQKTARVLMAGCDISSAEKILFALHGYAQTADDMVLSLAESLPANMCLIVPEALNHFYAKGFQGRVATCWMTRHMREDAIEDYCHYLQQVYHLYRNRTRPDAQFLALGFSQGVATLSRWILRKAPDMHMYFFHSGLPADEWLNDLNKVVQKTFFLYGDQDPFIEQTDKEKILTLMKNKNIDIIEFQGGHTMNPDVLLNSFHETAQR